MSSARISTIFGRALGLDSFAETAFCAAAAQVLLLKRKQTAQTIQLTTTRRGGCDFIFDLAFPTSDLIIRAGRSAAQTLSPSCNCFYPDKRIGMKTLIQYLAVAVGGSLGAMARLGVATLCGRLFGTGFPTGTFIINISGSFFLGWFIASFRGRGIVSDTTYLAIATGFVGAYTTFSTYMFESHSLMTEGAWLKALLNVVGSVVLGLLAVWLGVCLARA
jgi:CrcB protein